MKIRGGMLALALTAAAAWAPPLAAESALKVEKLADGVWAAAPEEGANVGWFLFGDGVIAVDAGANASIAAEILKSISETAGKPVRALILTHSHADHSAGARAFVAAGARVICQENVAGQILAYVTQAATDPTDPLAGKPSLRPVVESISQRAILLDGIHNVQVYFLGPAHTSGDLVVYLSGDKILFAGDIASNGRMPFMQSPDVDPVSWEHALELLAGIPVEKMVPGHGEIGPTSGIADSHAYVKRVNELATRFVRSGIRDDMIDAQIRNPENVIPNVPVNDEHIANVKAAVKAIRDKEARKPTPVPTPPHK
jgi:cyclase